MKIVRSDKDGLRNEVLNDRKLVSHLKLVIMQDARMHAAGRIG